MSIVDDENISYCKNVLSKYQNKIYLPKDIVTKDNKIRNIDNLNDTDMGYDIGPETIKH